jgi:diguanylate cyclase (GGDEF)-like protein
VEIGKNHMAPLLVDGVNGAQCRWCNPEILVRAEACRALRTGHPVDGIANPGICYAFQAPESTGERGHICLPIMQSGSVGYVLQLVAPKESAPWLTALIPFVNVYLREAAPVLESKRLMESLRETNLRDPMTGLNNRRFLEEYLETLLATTQRHKSHMTLLMLDLDFFKVVNDTHGHDAGDAVLKVLARTLRQTVRASDFVIRYGGEEFLILLQETGAEGGMKVAENIRLAVEQSKIPIAGGVVLQKTISIGVADFPEDSAAFWQTLKFADVALYHAKQSGRNQVVRFTPELWTEKQGY